MRTLEGNLSRRRGPGLGGFTLAEALVASLVMAIVAASATLPLVAGEQQRQEADKLKYAVQIGQALMAEVLARPLATAAVADKVLGPSGLETSRKAYLNVDAFHGYQESDRVVKSYDGNAIADSSVSGFWRSVSVQFVTFSGQVVGDNYSLALVQVDVYHGSTRLVRFSRVVSVEE